MRHFLTFGVVAVVAIACGGTTSLGEGRQGATDGGGTGGAASGGETGSGGAPGAACKDPSECAVPELCRLCADGSSACAKADCVDGQCTTTFPPCGGGAGGTGGGTGSACKTLDDCVKLGAPCEVCPDGTNACPKVECLNGECVGSVPGCSGGGGTGGGCTSAAECAVPAICKVCSDGSYSCATAACIGGKCETTYPACGGDPGTCTSDSQCMAPAVCEVCPDGSYSCASGSCMAGKCVTTFPGCNGGTGGAEWFRTCGDPVCRDPAFTDAGTGVAPCDPNLGQKETAPCQKEGDVCDPGYGCGVLLQCSTKDPAVMCPISRAKFKQDIEYLSAPEREKLATDIQSIPLVRYRYKDAPEREHLGFIIEDVEPSPSVDSRRDQVDLYGYTSMAVAALQQQHAQIEKLEREVRELKAELSRQR